MSRGRATSENSVSVDPFRSVAKDQDISIVAIRLDWYTRKGAPDVDRVRRTLGLKLDYTHGGTYRRERMTLDMAERMCRALGKDPWEMDL